MKESSSYKHLTAILAALMICIVVAIIVLFVLLTTTDFTQTNSSEQNQVNTTVGLPSDMTSSSDTTTSGNSNPPASSAVTTKDSTDSPVSSLTPPVTNAPSTDPIGPVNGSAYGDNLDSLGLYIEWTTVSYNAITGNSTIKLSLYCDSYSLVVGPRYNNYLIINDERIEFTTERISVPTDDYKARTLLYSTEYVVEKTSPSEQISIRLEAGWHFQGTYSGEHAEWLTLTTDFVV